MKTLRDVFVLAMLLLGGQTVYGMGYQFQNIDQGICYIGQKMYYQYQQPDGSIAFECLSENPIYQYPPTDLALPYLDLFECFEHEKYPMDYQKPVDSFIFRNMPTQLNLTVEINLSVRRFFQNLIDDGEIQSFARDLIQNAYNNDEIQLVSKGYKAGLNPPPLKKKVNLPIDILKRASYLKEKTFNLYLDYSSNELQQYIKNLFCSPLYSNNLIKLSHFAYDVLLFSHDQVEVICILSLAFFTTIEQFNAIDRLRWAVKKGLVQLTEKTLQEGIHPNWVVERGGITALRTSEINKTFKITELLLNVRGIDTTGYQDQNSYTENRIAEKMRSILRA